MMSLKKLEEPVHSIFDVVRSTGLVLILTTFCIISSCSKATKTAASNELDYKEVANQALGNGVKFIGNHSEELFLCIKESKEIGNRIVSYMVLAEDGKVLIPKTKIGGEVSWVSEELLKINPIDRVPKTKADELVSDVPDNSYIINVKTNQRVREPKSKI